MSDIMALRSTVFFFVNCLSHQYLNVNSPCQCRSVLKWRQTLRGPRLFTAETLSMRQKIEKLNRTLYYSKLCWYFLCQGNDKCKKKGLEVLSMNVSFLCKFLSRQTMIFTLLWVQIS
jgi:hypothetical protein